jgi:mannitol 2-dehydrogenase
MPVFILPSLVEQLQRGGEIKRLSLCVASWLRFLGGIDEKGQNIPIDDPMAEKLAVHVKDGKIDPLAVLNMSEIFGTLGQQPKFVEQVCYYLELLYTHGARAALQQCID